MRISLGLSSQEAGDEEGEEVGDVSRKSLSNERTFRDESSSDVLRDKLQSLCRGVAEEMAASVPPLAGKMLALKVKAANFEVKNKQVTCQRGYFGFDANFNSGPKSSGSAGDSNVSSWGCEAVWSRKGAGPTASGVGVLEQRDGDGIALSAKGAAEEGAASASGDDSFEREVARVAKEMYSVLLPLLEEQFPCSLRLMGVRISSFRGACATLEKGQQQLQKFFANPARPPCSLKQEAIPCSSTPTPCINASSARNNSVTQQVDKISNIIVDVLESSDEEVAVCIRPDATKLPDTSPAQASAPTVCCPVCNMMVPVSDADSHVNRHYDVAVPQPLHVANSAATEAPAKRRKAAASVGERPGTLNFKTFRGPAL